MLELIIAIILVIFIFGFLVFVHEGGHYIAAVLNGVLVEEFALGFGPKIIGKKIGNTEYKLNLIPLGGYVKMFGDQDPSSFKQSKESQGDPRSLISKKPWQRMIVISGGVIVNIIVAFIIFYFYLGIVGFKPSPILKITDYNFIGANQFEYQLYYSVDENSAAQNAQVPENGFLVSINGKDIESIDNLNEFLRDFEEKTVSVGIMSPDKLETKTYELKLPKKGIDGEVKLGLYPLSTNQLPIWDNGEEETLYFIVDEDNTDSPSSKSSLPKEGFMLSINGEKLSSRDDLTNILNNNENKEIEVLYSDYFGNEDKATVKLGTKSSDDNNVKMGLFVITSDIVKNVEIPTFYVIDYSNQKFTSGIFHTLNTTGYQAIGLGKIIGDAFKGDGEQLTQSVASPIKVGEVVYDLVSVNDFLNIINLTALISATLAFMNILPIPLLDGGQFLLTFIEQLRGKPLPEKLQDILGKVGFGFITGLGVVVLLKDFWQVIIQRIF